MYRWSLCVSILFLLVFSPVALAATCSGVDLYVSTTGSDTNTGTLIAPLLTITRADQILEARGANAGGSVIFVMPGAYTETRTPYGSIQLRADGSDGCPITLESYDPQNRAVLHGEGSHVVLALDYANHRIVRNFIIENGTKGITGIYANAVIENNTIRYMRDSGNNNPSGIGTSTSPANNDNIIKYNRVYNITTDGTGAAMNAMAIVFFQGNRNVIHNNEIWNANVGIRQKHHQQTPAPFELQIYANKISNASQAGIQLGSSGANVTRNLIINANEGVRVGYGDMYQANNGFRNNTIERNTIVNAQTGVNMQWGTADQQTFDAVIKNNIIQTTGNMYRVQDWANLALSNYNCYSQDAFYVLAQSSASIASMQAQGYDSNSVISNTVDPQSYRLQQGSACRNAGSDGLHIGVWTSDADTFTVGIPESSSVSDEPEPPVQAICEATGPGRCFYINPVNGNDNNNGSFTAPWMSFSNVISWYQPSYRPAGWRAIGPGDVIYLLDGTVNTVLIPGGWNNSCSCSQPNLGSPGMAYFRTVSGTEQNPIRLKNYPGHAPKIGDSMDAPFNNGLGLASSSWWVVSGIEFTNISGTCVSLVDNSNDIVFNNLSVNNCARKDTDGNPAGIKLTRVYRATIANSTFYDTFWDPFLATPAGGGSWFLRGAGIQLFRGGNITVYGNTFFQTKQGRDPSGNPAGYANCMFQKHAQTDSDGFLHVYNNTFRDCSTGGNTWAFGTGTQNTHFHHNLIINSIQTPIHVADFGGITYQVNQLFEFNTIVNSKAFSMGPSITRYDNVFPTLPQNITFRNNLVVDTTGSYTNDDNFIDIGTYMNDTVYAATMPALQFGNNCYFNPNTALRFNIGRANNGGTYGNLGALYTFAQWQGLGFDTNSVTADPLFVNAAAEDFRVQEGSPCSTMGKYAAANTPAVPSRRVGDLNGDSVVDIQDVIMIIQNFKRRQSFDTGADINSDGLVNVLDMVLLGKNWG